MAAALKTWSTGGTDKKWWEQGGGGTPWDSMAYDPDLDLLYVGTGNGASWNRNLRSPGGGDNLYLSSIVALKPDTGELVWYYQTTPGDDWDYTATQHIILADIAIDGETAQGADAGAEERLLLCARPHQRKADLGEALHDDHLGERRRHEDRPADRESDRRATTTEHHPRKFPDPSARTTGSRCRSIPRPVSSTSR